MKGIIVVVYDKVAKQFTAPLTFNNDYTAIRYFKRNTSSVGSIDDFKMLKIGTFDDESGKLKVVETEVIIDGLSLVNGVENGKDKQ